MMAVIRRRSCAAWQFGGALFLTAAAVSTAEENVDNRISLLIVQLGDDVFAVREAASSELMAIGEPALGSLRIAATSSDPEIRWRAEWTIEEISLRVELAKSQGDWKSPEGIWMKLSGDRWSSGTPTFGPHGGRVYIRGRDDKATHVDLLVDEGPMQGQTCLMIWRMEGDEMQCCWTYDSTRPTEFKAGGSWYASTFTREKSVPPTQEMRHNVNP
jgi:uncharacterized protein (TIGR03067 family)